MNKVSEHNIEQYIRFPEELNANQKKAIERAIEESDEVRQIFQFLSEYYNELDRVSGVQPFIIPLKPMHQQPDSGPVVLAAMTSGAQASALVTRATLVSEEYKTLVRVLENQENQSLQFHVISEDTELSEHAILSLMKPGIDLVTDKYGKLKGVQDLSDIKWDSISSVLRLPAMKVEIDLRKVGNAFKLRECNIHLSKSGETLEVDARQQDLGFSKVLMIQDGYSELRQLEHSTIVFGNLDFGEKAGLYFYE